MRAVLGDYFVIPNLRNKIATFIDPFRGLFITSSWLKIVSNSSTYSGMVLVLSQVFGTSRSEVGLLYL